VTDCVCDTFGLCTDQLIQDGLKLSSRYNLVFNFSQSYNQFDVIYTDISGPCISRITDLKEDILRLIFENFDFQPGTQTATQTRKDLLSAAKACKAFAEPALHSLWRVLPSLLPLLMLLPSAEIVDNRYVSLKSSQLSCHLLPLHNF
jgi:hypothetical protein